MTLSKIISTTIEKGRLIVKILGLGNDDIKTVFNVTPFGIDSRVFKNYRGIYSDTGVKGEKVLLGIIYDNTLTEDGEMRLYSVNAAGDEVFSLHLKNTGNLELGGDADNLVRYSVLKAQFDELNNKFNDLVTAFNQHMHATAGTGAPSIPTPIPDIIPALESTADITNSKINNLLTT